MIRTEMIGEHIRHWSDINMMMRQIETGILYEDAVDVIPCPYTYEETDIPIDADIEDHDALNILLGRSDDDETPDDPEAP